MPRKAKRTTQSGAPAGPLVRPVGVPYGEGERALEAQRRTPVPSGPPPAPGPQGGGMPTVSGPPPGVTATPGGGAERLAAALAAAGRMQAGNSLYAPTRRPMEPLTAGLPIGAGPGPEVLRTGDRVVRTLRMLADVTSDVRFQDLADVASRLGGK